jgi:hypothetical protein
MQRLLIIPFLLLTISPLSAQVISPQEKEYFDMLHERFNGDNALQTVAFVEQRWRLPGNKGFNESIYYVEKILQQAGFVNDTNKEASGPLTYRIEKRPMRRPTWEPVSAQLFIVGDNQPLEDFKTNFNMLAMFSASTPAEGVTAELVDVGKGTAKDYQDKDVKGKIVIADGGIGGVYANAIKNGAIGAISYSLPAYNQPAVHQNSIQFQGISYSDSLNQKWGILLSYAAREKLHAAMAKGQVMVKVIVNSRIYQSEELTLVANARGKKKPDQRFVFSAHVQEPGANDNATGVGTLAEMARITAEFVKARKIGPDRTITFLWGDEIVSTGRYIRDDSLRAKGIYWGLSLDMVGEDTKKTGGTFLIEKIPDPSAIWTRGDDHHTEWGGRPLKESDMFPNYFTDVLLNRCYHEAQGNDWVVKANPFEGGSDHTPFLEAKIPGLLMWHFTDVYYHTDGDRLNMVSAEEMKHVGVAALATAYLLTNANEKTAVDLIKDVEQSALQRLLKEYAVSKVSMIQEPDLTKETHIQEVWRDWYIKGIATAANIPVEGAGKKTMKAIAEAQEQIQKISGVHIKELNK